MVEVERPDASVVPAQHARSAGLRDERQPRPSPPNDYALLPALLAAVVAASHEDELGLARAWRKRASRTLEAPLPRHEH